MFLYGDSGNGKSSLVNAGLLPQARDAGLRARPRARAAARGRGARDRADRDLRRRDGVLAAACSRPSDDGRRAIVLSIAEFEERVRAAAREHQPLIVFDQFEEILTLFEDDDAIAAHALGADDRRLLRERAAGQAPVRLSRGLPRPRQAAAARAPGARRPGAAARPAVRRRAARRSSAARSSASPATSSASSTPPLAETAAGRARRALRHRRGQPVGGADGLPAAVADPPIPAALLDAKGVQGLLEDELGEALAAFAADLRAAAVALLSQMVTSAGTRNVISAEDLRHRVRDEDPEHRSGAARRGARAPRARLQARAPRAPPRPLPLRDHQRVPRAVDQRAPRGDCGSHRSDAASNVA